jgi:hypothetical protein
LAAPNGRPETLASLAEAKALPIDFPRAGPLHGLGLADRIGGGVNIPYYSEDGAELFTRVRGQPGGPRFYHPRNVKPAPYGMNRLDGARKAGTLHICEGESDTWTMWFHDYPALGIPGANNTACLLRMEAGALAGIDNVYVWPDNDHTADQFGRDVADALHKFGYAGRIWVCRLPQGVKDLNELHLRLKDEPNAFEDAVVERQAHAEEIGPTGDDQQPTPTTGRSTRGHSTPAPDPNEDWSAQALLDEDLPELVAVVPRLIYEGLALLAGRPKTGKSFASLQLCLAVASGNKFLGCFEVNQGDVLYLALEDGRRRLQKRLRQMIASRNARCPAALDVRTCWPRADEGGVDAIRASAERRARPVLVVIDTVGKCRRRRRGKADLYQEDYEDGDALHQLALELHLAVVLNFHTVKLRSGDFLDDVSGTTGVTAPADSVLVLDRKRGAPNAELKVTGRDVEERSINLAWDAERTGWKVAEVPAGLSPEDRAPRWSAVRNVLCRTGPATLKEIAQKMDVPEKDQPSLKRLLNRRTSDGYLKREKGRYTLTPDAPTS